MRLAFLIYKYFPYGGLQRDFLRLLNELWVRGHHCRVYCTSWQGETPPGLDVRVAPVTRGSRVRRNERFLTWVGQCLVDQPVDGVIGFNKMPGLDVYFAGDTCFLAEALEERSVLYRFGWRFRHFARWEQAVFDRAGHTEILLLNLKEKSRFQQYYNTPEARLHLLPPGIEVDRKRPADADAQRAEMRHELGLAHDVHTLLFVGSAFARKGLDRAIRGLSHLARTYPQRRFCLLVVGQDGAGKMALLARRQQVSAQVRFLGGRDDIPKLLLAADLMVHPARNEAAGIVLLEALVAGLPILVTDVCGYAGHIERAGAGQLIPAPFEQAALNAALIRMLDKQVLHECRKNALDYARTSDLYSLHATAADVIEKILQSAEGWQLG